MTDFNEQFNKYLDFQAQAYEPLRAFGGAAAETFEKLSRQNYAVLGDYVDFAVQQAKLPGQVADANDYAAKQFETTREFGERLAERVQGYVAIARAAQARTEEAAATQVKATRKKAA